MKRIFAILGIIFSILLGMNLYIYFKDSAKPVTEKESKVLLEKVRKVCKLVTVEADFLERYTEKNIRPMTVYIPFPTTFRFPKEAIIEITGTVMVGYNMEKASITMDEKQRKVIIQNLPEPEILGIDHEIKYENLTESFFNEFEKEDYTQLAKNAKEELKNRALEDKLLQRAEAEGNDLVEIIRAIVQSAGWSLEVEEKPFDAEQLLN